MNFVKFFAAILVVASAVTAFPSNASLEASCTISSYNDVSSVTKACTTITVKGFTVPAGKQLDLNLKSGSKVSFTGVIKFDYKEWEGPLMEITGSDVHITGSSGFYLDGLGSKYWDGKGDDGKTKPKFVKVKTTGNSVFKNFDLKNCPRQCFSIDAACSKTQFTGCDVDVSAGHSKGKNTDGYDVSGSGITISSATVNNQDDCVVINRGSDIKVAGVTCIGGHGLSLSVKEATIKNVVFENSKVQNSRNGIHVKTETDGSGVIENIEYVNIELSGITNFGVNVQQDYKSGKSTKNPTANIPIKGLTLTNVHGSMSGSSESLPVYVLCGKNGCSGWKWSGVSIGNGKKSNSCTNYTPPGFNCK